MVQQPKNRNEGPISLSNLAARNNDPNLRSFVNAYEKFLGKSQKKDASMLLKGFPTKEKYLAPKNPIVLCHGLSGFDKLILIPSIYQLTKMIKNSIQTHKSEHFIEDDEEDEDARNTSILEVEYWIGVKERLQEKGCTVITAKVPGFGSIEERAVILNAFLEKETKRLKENATEGEIYNTENASSDASVQKDENIKLNLIAHSMGGLDCRFLISRLPNKGYKVLSLTTVSTPHRGSEMADYVVRLFEELKQAAPVEGAPQLLPACFYELTTSYMEYFNKVTLDDPNVSYFSYGSSFMPKWYNALRMPWKVINNATNGDPNDGMVTVKSSKWGEYRGTLTNTDHLDLINWKNKIQKDIGDLFENTNKSAEKTIKPDVDILNFYLQIADDLARKGF